MATPKSDSIDNYDAHSSDAESGGRGEGEGGSNEYEEETALTIPNGGSGGGQGSHSVSSTEREEEIAVSPSNNKKKPAAQSPNKKVVSVPKTTTTSSMNKPKPGLQKKLQETEETPKKSSSWQCCAITCWILAIVIALIALFAGGGGTNENQEPTMAPTSQEYQYLLNLVSPISGMETLTDMTKPQYYALEWLTNEQENLMPSSSSTTTITTDSKTVTKEELYLIERYVLAVLHLSTTTTSPVPNDASWWKDTLHFMTDKPVCEWRVSSRNNPLKGVACNDQGMVVALYLDNNNLKGRLPMELSALSQLEVLSVANNQLYGSIPSSWGVKTSMKPTGGFGHLHEFNVRGNRLSGSIPSSLGHIFNFTMGPGTFDFSSNLFTGSLEDAFCTLQHSIHSPRATWMTIPPPASLIADCGGDIPEVDCPCCSECCAEGETCDLKICSETANSMTEFYHEMMMMTTSSQGQQEQGGINDSDMDCQCTGNGRLLSCTNPGCEVCSADGSVCAVRADYGYMFDENDLTTSDFRCNMKYTRGHDELITFKRKAPMNYTTTNMTMAMAMANVLYETENSNNEEGMENTNDVGVDINECSVYVNGEECNSCAMVQCEVGDPVPSGIRVDCKNLGRNRFFIDPCDGDRNMATGSFLEIFNQEFVSGDNTCQPCFQGW